MKLEFLVIAITAFFIYDIYKDQQYSKLLKNYKKYYQMAGIGFFGLSMLIFFKKNPNQGKSMLGNAVDMLKYLPIDKNSKDMLTPLLYINKFDGFSNMNMNPNMYENNMQNTPQYRRMMNSGRSNNGNGNNRKMGGVGNMGGNGEIKPTKRSVSETKKKFVASRQNWCCNSCKQQLPAWFEVDHIVRLEHGGSNHVDNLVALCRNCHGKKTAMENMG
jgi:hypothetical protein